MAGPATISITQGTTKPDIVWRMMIAGQPFDGTGSEFILTIAPDARIRGDANTIRHSTADASGALIYDNTTGRLRWRRTLAESRIIRSGQFGAYEIERRIAGDQSILVKGAIIGVGSISDD